MLRKRNKKSKQSLVPIRQLAEFAADPVEFDRSRGKVRNKAAVRAGNQGEKRLAKTGSISGSILVVIIVIAILWIYL